MRHRPRVRTRARRAETPWVRAIVALAVLQLLLALLPRVLQGQGATWVEVERRVAMRDGRTADEVKQEALREALAEAVRRVAGVRVQGTQQSRSGDSAGTRIDQYVQAVRLDATGRATRWEMTRDEWRSEKTAVGAQPYYVLGLRVQVTPELGVADPAFSVSLSARATTLMVRGSQPAQNDEIIAVVRASADAYITLVSIAGDSVFVLAPNALTPSVLVSPVGSVEIPDAESRRIGLHLRVTLPVGVRGRTESLVAVATRRPVVPPGAAGAGDARDTGTLTLAAFNQWLVGIPLDQRATAELPIEVRHSP